VRVLIIGSEGSMGKRYQAVLKYLKTPFDCVDAIDSEDYIVQLAKESRGVIIATPTETHSYFLHLLSPLVKAPILCEKPVCKDIDELKTIIDVCRANGTNLTMMMQYKFLDFSQMLSLEGPSHYDYFRTGNDGLYWDTFQTIALARGPVVVRNESPIWDCQLNGRRINFSDMDNAYISAVGEWLQNPGDDLDELLAMHIKVKKYELEYGS
jgi:hypothetical protein